MPFLILEITEIPLWQIKSFSSYCGVRHWWMSVGYLNGWVVGWLDGWMNGGMDWLIEGWDGWNTDLVHGWIRWAKCYRLRCWPTDQPTEIAGNKNKCTWLKTDGYVVYSKIGGATRWRENDQHRKKRKSILIKWDNKQSSTKKVAIETGLCQNAFKSFQNSGLPFKHTRAGKN